MRKKVALMLQEIHQFSSTHRLSEELAAQKVEVWTKELLAVGITPENLEDVYRRAKLLRRLTNPTNHYPMAGTELISAFDEIKAEEATARARYELLHPVCEFCVDSAKLGRKCPFHGELRPLTGTSEATH